MTEQNTAWHIEEQDADYQIAYWKRRAEHAEAQLKKEQRRKAPEALAEVEQELKKARETAEHFKQEARVWKEVAGKMSDRVTILESDGAVAVLKRERDNWRSQWRNCTRRLGHYIEHVGLLDIGPMPNRDED